VSAGCHMCVSLGKELHPIKRLQEGARCTWFYPDENSATVRKQWIAGTLKPAGELFIDQGALNALMHGKSLLPAGVTKVTGSFERGDAVLVRSAEGVEVARGLSAYSSDDAERIRGRQSNDIEALLGYRGRDEMIHRDDMVVTRAA
jgi:glutamate 5-kinase